MRIVSLRSIQGPNVFHHLPIVIMRVDLEQWADMPSNEVPFFNENLKNLLPGLYEHTCSTGRVGGFYERLEKGTYFAHIVEHIALELSKLSGLDIGYGKSRYAGQKGLYDIVVRSTNDKGIKHCLEFSVVIANRMLQQQSVQLSDYLPKIIDQAKEGALGLSGECIYRAAQKAKIPVIRIAENSLVQLGYGKRSQRVQAAITSKTNLIAADIVQDKELTKIFLRKALIPTPYGVVIENETEIDEAVKSWAGPYVIKPIDGNHGRGVFLNLLNAEEIKTAFKSIQSLSSKFVIEKMHFGKDYRILVIDGKFCAASERVPPQVIGDGVHTISELIDLLNADPLRGEGHESFFTKVIPDEVLLAFLKKQNLDLESIVMPGLTVQLRGNANLSSGGTSIDMTENVSEEIKLLCERVSRVVGLDICGIDIVAKDISATISDSELTVIEVNAGPGLRMHLLGKMEGQENVGTKIINMLYKNPAESRIPIVSVTGTNGKTTVVRMLHRIMCDANIGTVGMTNTEGIWIGNNKIAAGDMSGPSSAAILLQDSSVENAVFEIARGGLLRSGLAYDWSDVAVFTNIAEDHIGQDGIESVEDILWIKSLVGERVKKHGSIVLNADDTNCLKLLENSAIKRHQCKFILFSNGPENPALMESLSSGAIGLWVEDGHIIQADKYRVRSLGYIADIPVTLGGKADFQVSNALAAVGGALGLGIEAEQIIRSLSAFNPTLDNQGRLNLFQIKNSYVILDYGHNPSAISSIGKLVSKYKRFTKTAILGLPGDRSTELIELTALQAAQYFDKIILRDEHDLRGRNSGEIPRLLSDLYKKEIPDFQHEVILKEEDAVSQALSQIKPNHILVIFCENIDSVQNIMKKFNAVLIDDIPYRDEFIHDQTFTTYGFK